MGDYNLDYLTPLEKENLDTVVLPYGFIVASPCLPTRVCKSTKIHIEYILAENIHDEKKLLLTLLQIWSLLLSFVYRSKRG